MVETKVSHHWVATTKHEGLNSLQVEENEWSEVVVEKYKEPEVVKAYQDWLSNGRHTKTPSNKRVFTVR